MKRIFAALGLLLYATAYGAPTAYDVDVLIFENRLPDIEGGELWTREKTRPPSPTDFADAVVVNEVTPTDSSLRAAAAALERDNHYRLLVHRRWRQTAEEKSAVKPVRLRNGSGQVDGSLRFYMSRFLLVDLEVILRDKSAAPEELAYRISEHRRIKPQEINYFDHPKFGVLIRVAPAPKE